MFVAYQSTLKAPKKDFKERCSATDIDNQCTLLLISIKQILIFGIQLQTLKLCLMDMKSIFFSLFFFGFSLFFDRFVIFMFFFSSLVLLFTILILEERKLWLCCRMDLVNLRVEIWTLQATGNVEKWTSSMIICFISFFFLNHCHIGRQSSYVKNDF